MMKKFILPSLVVALMGSTAMAQDFTMKADTIFENTTGSISLDYDNDAVKMYNWIYNNTPGDLVVNWQLLSKDFPADWFIYGICDNSSCRPPNHPAVVSFAAQETNLISATDSSELEPRIAVPATGGNGIGIVKIKVWTANTVDTSTYVLTKQGTSVSQIAIGDTRVAVYPNPSDKNISVYSDKSLNVAKISILNIVGREEFSTVASKTREITEISTSSLAKGMYMIHLTDATGKLVTSRKFVKN